MSVIIRYMSKWYLDPRRTKPRMHWVKCSSCGHNFKERSDPRAEIGLCDECKPSARVVVAAVDDWWAQFWREHPEIDPLREEEGGQRES